MRKYWAWVGVLHSESVLARSPCHRGGRTKYPTIGEIAQKNCLQKKVSVLWPGSPRISRRDKKGQRKMKLIEININIMCYSPPKEDHSKLN